MPVPLAKPDRSLATPPPRGVQTPAQVATRFQRGNRLASRAHRAALDPIAPLRKRVREVFRGVMSSKIPSAAGSVLIQCLRLELELLERADIGQRLAKCDAEVASLEARYAELRASRLQER